MIEALKQPPDRRFAHYLLEQGLWDVINSFVSDHPDAPALPGMDEPGKGPEIIAPTANPNN